MEKLLLKIEKYLMDNFPGKSLKQCKKISGENIEIYGFKGMRILVVEQPTTVHYQFVTLKEQMSEK